MPKIAAPGQCPCCSEPVENFEIERGAAGDVVIFLEPCGCASHSEERHYEQFLKVVGDSGEFLARAATSA